MEIDEPMPESLRIRIEEQSQTSDARRVVSAAAADLGFDEISCGKISIVVTEFCTNLLKHAGGGELLLSTYADGAGTPPVFELLALDKGPGMGDLARCMRDGFSTGGSPGQGLGAIVRLSDASDFHSETGRGTAILARWNGPAVAGQATPAAPFHVGAVNVCKPGQEVCGDSWGAEQTVERFTLMLADGLGHGLEAKTASLEAVRMLHRHPDLPPGRLLERVHQALRSTRGAAVAVAHIDLGAKTLVFAGIGNVCGQIYAGAESGPHLVSVNGTAGFQTHRIREFSYPWPDKGILAMHSDGLASNAGMQSHPGLAFHDAGLIAGVLYRDFARGNDDATAVIARPVVSEPE